MESVENAMDGVNSYNGGGVKPSHSGVTGGAIYRFSHRVMVGFSLLTLGVLIGLLLARCGGGGVHWLPSHDGSGGDWQTIPWDTLRVARDTLYAEPVRIHGGGTGSLTIQKGDGARGGLPTGESSSTPPSQGPIDTCGSRWWVIHGDFHDSIVSIRTVDSIDWRLGLHRRALEYDLLLPRAPMLLREAVHLVPRIPQSVMPARIMPAWGGFVTAGAGYALSSKGQIFSVGGGLRYHRLLIGGEVGLITAGRELTMGIRMGYLF